MQGPVASPIKYKVRFPEPATHYARIEAILPASDTTETEVFMAVWTPGSYLIREYARHVEELVARDGQANVLSVSKSRKNRWIVHSGGAAEIHLSYRVYCREMSVRTNWVEHGFAFLNGAPAFITLVNDHARPHQVELELPHGWATSITGLAASGAPHTYMAPDYDTLADSPILAGNPAVCRFDVEGIPHYIANQGGDGVWDEARATADVQRIVQSQRHFWGSLPYSKYVFLNLITEAGGGLEHSNSCVLMASRWATSARKTYLSWLNIVSHEFFHVWNIKRLRPVELGPFDYENENPTRSLWVAEGITDYYGPMLVHRAGIASDNEYLDTLSGVIHNLQTTPGRHVQSAELSSFDAWIKLYRPDENTSNTAISYYTKGTVIAWLLDARIRIATNDGRSLDDVMRLAFTRHAGARGFTPEEFRAAAEEMAGVSLREFFERSVESTEELDYREALGWFGLRFRFAAGSKKAWLGADTKNDAGRLVVTRIPRGTPAYESGLNVDDEILALGDFRVRADQYAARLENYHSGETVPILIARREKLMRMEVVLGHEPNKWQLEAIPDATALQRQHLKSWLAGQ